MPMKYNRLNDIDYFQQLREFANDPTFEKFEKFSKDYFINPFPCEHISSVPWSACDVCPMNGALFSVKPTHYRTDSWCAMAVYTFYYAEEDIYNKYQGSILLTVVRLLSLVDQE